MNDIIDALKTIVARSPRAAGEAMRTIVAARNNSPVLQARYAQVLIRALADPDAKFTDEEREALAAGIDAPEPGGGRDLVFRLRLSGDERMALENAAAAAGLNMSDYVRRRLFEFE